MSKKTVTVIKKNDPGYGNGKKSGNQQPKPTTAPTQSKTSAHTLQPQKNTPPPQPKKKKKKNKKKNNSNSPKPISPVKKQQQPKLPPDPTLVENLGSWPELLSSAGDLLDRSEGRAGDDGVSGKWGAHARKEHVGRKGDELESRGKFKDGAYLNDYEQNKSMAMALATQHGQSTWDKSNHSAGEFSTFAQPKLTPWMTQPIVRNVERTGFDSNGKPIYEHYNAKVHEASGKFTKDTGMNEGRRVQTLFGTGVERLPKPLPGGQVPTSKVSIDSISSGSSDSTSGVDSSSIASSVNGQKLRKTNSPYKDPNAKLGVSSDTPQDVTPSNEPQTTPPVEHQPVGESTNAPSSPPITSDEGSKVSSDTNEGEVVSDTEGGGTEVGGVPSEGVSTDKQVENTPAPVKLSKGQKARLRKKKKKELEKQQEQVPTKKPVKKNQQKWKTKK